MFKAKNPQRFFGGTNFVVGETLYEPPALTPAPSIYLDKDGSHWAVRLAGATPRIYDLADVVACQVMDDDGSAERVQVAEAGDLASLVASPMRYSRANAAKKGQMCFALGVVIAVRGTDVTIQVPYITWPTRKSSPVYQQLRAAADHLHDALAPAGDAEGVRDAQDGTRS